VFAAAASGYAQGSISFGGRGKALIFELPEKDVVDTAALPLWLMALVRQPPSATDALAPAEGAAASAQGSTAVLFASACVDLREQVRVAAASARCSSNDCGGGAAASPVAFRRCSFRMTAVRDADCSLELDCYLRVYAGSHRELSGGELLLETSTMLPFAGPPAVVRDGQDDAEVYCGADSSRQGNRILPRASSLSSRAGSSERGGSLEVLNAAPATLPPPSARAAQPSATRPSWPGPGGCALGGGTGVGDTFFPGEIRLAGTAPARHTANAPAADATAAAAHAPAVAAALAGAQIGDQEAQPTAAQLAALPPDVVSTLPLVSQLLREMRQIRSVG